MSEKKKLGRPYDNPKTPPEVRAEIVRLYRTEGWTQKKIAARFDVAQSVVQRILSGE